MGGHLPFIVQYFCKQSDLQRRDLTVNKKVLLRECKRHTARRVVSARSAALSPDGEAGGGGGGVVVVAPSSPDSGCVPQSNPNRGGGAPHPVLRVVSWGNTSVRKGYPLLGRMGYPSGRLGVPPPFRIIWVPPGVDRHTY